MKNRSGRTHHAGRSRWAPLAELDYWRQRRREEAAAKAPEAAKAARPAKAPESAPPAPGGVLRVFRAAALAGIAVVIAAASAASFAESYRGLYEWAGRHDLAGFWRAVFPLQVDAFIITGELVLFIAMADRWRRRDRAGAWAVALLGVAVSVAGNVGHLGAADIQSRATAAVPPVAAFAALWLGLTVVKRAVSGRPGETARPAAPEAAPAAAEPQAGQVPSPVPSTTEAAAEASMRATLAAGNPWSAHGLATQFGLPRKTATEIHRQVLASANGSHAADRPDGTIS